jgi:hypothetical protein
MTTKKMRALLGEAKAFPHGTVRSWKRGTVMKGGTAWSRLNRDKPMPLASKVPEVQQSPFGGNAYAAAAPAFSASVSEALAEIVDQLNEASEYDALRSKLDQLVKEIKKRIAFSLYYSYEYDVGDEDGHRGQTLTDEGYEDFDVNKVTYSISRGKGGYVGVAFSIRAQNEPTVTSPSGRKSRFTGDTSHRDYRVSERDFSAVVDLVNYYFKDAEDVELDIDDVEDDTLWGQVSFSVPVR